MAIAESSGSRMERNMRLEEVVASKNNMSSMKTPSPLLRDDSTTQQDDGELGQDNGRDVVLVSKASSVEESKDRLKGERLEVYCSPEFCPLPPRRSPLSSPGPCYPTSPTCDSVGQHRFVSGKMNPPPVKHESS